MEEERCGRGDKEEEMTESRVNETVAQIGVYIRQIEINLASIRISTEIIEKAHDELRELCYALKLKEVEEKEEELTGFTEAIGITKEQIFEYIDEMHKIDTEKANREQELLREIVLKATK